MSRRKDGVVLRESLPGVIEAIWNASREIENDLQHNLLISVSDLLGTMLQAAKESEVEAQWILKYPTDGECHDPYIPFFECPSCGEEWPVDVPKWDYANRVPGRPPKTLPISIEHFPRFCGYCGVRLKWKIEEGCHE